jgi:flagellar biosynthesis protein FlhA
MADLANFPALPQNFQAIFKGNVGIPLILVVLLGMIILPIPPFLLDVFFTFNIALSIVVLLVCIYALKPLDFGVFPSILLIATLLRLSLNVASTRVVLLEGHEGGDAAGKVIEAFGEVLIGGNYTVGLVVFLILMIINFVVVTKGAGRVSEVSARFTLDAMPGKQMAIDADLNAGLIDADQAKARRAEVSAEADFYGSMDGASKFVKGDAIAGIMILAINIIGGLGIGMLQHDLTLADATEKYVLLTIGDGLVAQIPSLLLSTATAIMVTRNRSSEQMGSQIMSQMFGSFKALGIAGSLLILMGLIPGMPHFVFLGLGVLAVTAAWFMYKKQQLLDGGQPAAAAGNNHGKSLPNDAGVMPKTDMSLPESEIKELGWDDVEPVDMVGLEVGYRLIPLVDKSQGGHLLSRIKGVRKKLSQDLGFLIPSVHIRDNLDLLPSAYRITLMGAVIAEDEIHIDRELAINPGQVYGTLQGIEAKDPAFGMEAVWIEEEQKDQAQTLGYTVVDASTVVATHLNQILQQHAQELIGHEDVQKMLDILAATSPKLAEGLVPNTLTISQLLDVLQNLLMENVPVKDMRSIAESLANSHVQSQDTVGLIAAARIGLSRMIVQNIYGNATELPVLTLDPGLEQLLLKTLQGGQGNGALVLEPSMAERLRTSLNDAMEQQEALGNPTVLLVAGNFRAQLARFTRNSVQGLHVLAYQEIPDNKQITIVGTIGQ